MKYFIIILAVLISGCSAFSKNKLVTPYTNLMVGNWQDCGRGTYQGKVTGSGGLAIYNSDATYTQSVVDIYDDLKCTNKIDGIGVTIKGKYKLVGPSTLGDDIYDINLTNWGNTGRTCFTIVKITEKSILFGKPSGKYNCRSATRRHQILDKELFTKFKK
jgi:hypothetical protein